MYPCNRSVDDLRRVRTLRDSESENQNFICRTRFITLIVIYSQKISLKLVKKSEHILLFNDPAFFLMHMMPVVQNCRNWDIANRNHSFFKTIFSLFVGPFNGIWVGMEKLTNKTAAISRKACWVGNMESQRFFVNFFSDGECWSIRYRNLK